MAHGRNKTVEEFAVGGWVGDVKTYKTTRWFASFLGTVLLNIRNRLRHYVVKRSNPRLEKTHPLACVIFDAT